MNRNAHSLQSSVCRVGALLAICLTFVSLSALGQKSGDEGHLDQKLLFSGSSATNAAAPKIQVLAKLAAKGILGNLMVGRP
jgi:hypothetical protein